MKWEVLFLLLFVGVGDAIAQCDSTIYQSDTVGAVKAKLACFAAENKRLLAKNEQLASAAALARDKKTAAGPRWRIVAHLSPYFDPSEFSVDKCLINITKAIVGRGGTLVEQSDTWIDFQIGENPVYISCGVTPPSVTIDGKETRLRIRGGVYAAGTNFKATQDLTSLLIRDIFPQ